MEVRVIINGDETLVLNKTCINKEIIANTMDDPFSFKYSGKHDHGALPTLKQGNQFHDLEQFCIVAREKIGELLEPLVEVKPNMVSKKKAKTQGPKMSKKTKQSQATQNQE